MARLSLAATAELTEALRALNVGLDDLTVQFGDFLFSPANW